MKKIRTILIALLVIVCLGMAALYMYVRAHGRTVMTQWASELVGRPVDIGAVEFHFPLGLSLDDVRVEELGAARRVLLGLGAVDLITKDKNMQFSFVRIIEPDVTYRLPAKEAQTNIQQGRDTAAPVVPRARRQVPQKTDSPLGIHIRRLDITGGRLHIIPPPGEEEREQVPYRLMNIDMTFHDIHYPGLEHDVAFRAKGNLSGPDGRLNAGELFAEGWVNWPKKDMEAKLHCLNMDGRFFTASLGPIERKIKSFVANVDADIVSENNTMTVSCRLKIKDVVFAPAEDARNPTVEDMILEGVQSMGKEMDFNFRFTTSMDNFNIDKIPFSGRILN